MKKWLFVMMALCIVALAACSNEEGSYETIALNEVEGKMSEGYIVLDVREPNEFAEGHIPSAQNKPLSALQQEDFSELSKEEKYIVICRSGNRSQTASDILVTEGYDVVNVSEGMSSWTGDIE
ncbi:rhodanese-like domain-containing protein [Lysinibacillus sp. KU-BSD001]|uniref:rhodanese-like domain-containing protein n=1 Tax=Lysinibacillus sp. KU-BSD001 TaxID=3141328 RepID=UPI0036E959C9